MPVATRPPVVGSYAPPTAGADGRACPNCGATADGAFCAACGQVQRDRVRASLVEIARDGLEDVLDWDSKIVRSFRYLLFRPGVLTREYLAGRRVRHLRPLRLYFTASVLFFLALSTTVGGEDAAGEASSGETSSGEAAAGEAAAGDASADRAAPAPDGADSARPRPAFRLYGPQGDSRAGRLVEEGLARFGRLDAAEQQRRLVDGFQAHLPKALFALVPVFALLLAVLYRSRRRYYAEHFVFALHLHAFAFVLMAAGQVVPDLPRVPFTELLLAWGLGHLAVAMHRVYGGSRRGTAVRLVLLVPAYSMLLSLAVLGTLLVTLVLA